MKELTPDPFAACENTGCNHDLGRGVLIADLLNVDGPYTQSPLIDQRRGIEYAVADQPPPRSEAA
jgi:hypothetical protein